MQRAGDVGYIGNHTVGLTPEDVDELLSGLDSEAAVLQLTVVEDMPVILGGGVTLTDDSGLYTLGPVPFSLAVTGSTGRGHGRAAYILED